MASCRTAPQTTLPYWNQLKSPCRSLGKKYAKSPIATTKYMYGAYIATEKLKKFAILLMV